MDGIPDFDLFIDAKVVLPQDGKNMRHTTIIGRASNGAPNPKYQNI